MTLLQPDHDRYEGCTDPKVTATPGNGHADTLPGGADLWYMDTMLLLNLLDGEPASETEALAAKQSAAADCN